MSIKFRSVRIYLVIPVLILGICSMVSLAMTGVSLRSVSNVSKNIAQKQINSVSCLDAVKSNVIEMQKEVRSEEHTLNSSHPPESRMPSSA